MFTEFRRRRRLSKVKPGDGSRLREFRVWQLLTRSLFALDLVGPTGDRHVFEVDVRHTADSTTRTSPVSLYRDGTQIARATLPAAFTVPGGVIEVATSQYGLKRMHYVTDDGSEHLLRPHPRTQEGLRARFGRRFPRASAVLGAVAVVVLLIAAVLALLQGVDAVTHVPVVAAHLGAFTAPVHLSTTGKVVVGLAAALAGTERALTFRSRWVIGR
jgi:hypothetical protein